MEFTDKREQFPNPKLADLVPPMYVHFTFNADTKGSWRSTWPRSASSPRRPRTRARPRVSAAGGHHRLDANIGHVEVQLASGRKTFEVDPKGQLRNFKAGDRVTLTISKQGDREVVTADQASVARRPTGGLGEPSAPQYTNASPSLLDADRPWRSHKQQHRSFRGGSRRSGRAPPIVPVGAAAQ